MDESVRLNGGTSPGSSGAGQVGAVARSPLGASASRPWRVASGVDAEFWELPFCAQLNLRLAPAAPALADLDRALGLRLPLVPNRATSGGGLRALWLGPDEWLVVGPPGDSRALAASLEAVAAPHGGSVVDVSAQRTVLELRGPRAREVLSAGCSIDLHPAAFEADACAQTMLARVDVVLERPAPGTFRILVRASFAPYLARWLGEVLAEGSA